MDITELKGKIETGEIIELANGEDIAHLGKVKFGLGYVFIFNAKPLFSYKSFGAFARKVNAKILQYSLTESPA